MSAAIKVENLSKKYVIGHQSEGGYRTFRDVIATSAKNLGARSLAALAGRKYQRQGSHAEEFWALKNIEFNIEQGDRVGIIGRNGAGKSTLLKVLSRITEPTSGRATISGRVASLLEVGTGFHPELTGKENIFLNGAILGMSKSEIRARFDEIVDFAEIERFLDTPVKRYSSGMYMRLAFAVAAYLRTEIMIIDEVLAVGDLAFQKKCLGKMDKAATAGRTILFVSHNMGSIQSLCRRVILLENGEIKQDGEPEEIVREYISSSRIENGASLNRGYHVDQELIKKNKSEIVSITNCELINPEDETLGPRTGDPLTVCIHYSALRQSQSPAFVVKIKDLMGYEVIRLSTMPISGFVIDKLHSSGIVQLKINVLPLVAGNYSIDIGFVREGIEWLVRMEDLVKFQVSERDVYGSGLMMDGKRGLIVVPHSWEHSVEEKFQQSISKPPHG